MAELYNWRGARMPITELAEKAAQDEAERDRVAKARVQRLLGIRREHIEALERACAALDDSHEWPDPASKALVEDLLAELNGWLPGLTTLG